MNYAVIAPVAAAAVALFAAHQARRLALSPGWGDQAWFALTAVAAAGYALAATVSNADVSAPVAAHAARVQLAFMLLEVWGWLHYGDAFLGRVAPRPERYARALLPPLTLVALVPGAVLGDRVFVRASLGSAFQQRWAEPTWLGEVLVACCLALAVAGVGHFTRAWRRGVKQAGLHAVAIFTMLALGANDALVLAGLLDGPFLLDVGFVLPVAMVAGSLATRFGQDARELAELRGRLEGLVAERTQALARTQDALFRAERLAALGQFAAGVAHEVNNPAAVVSANLRFLREGLSAGPGIPERRATSQEAREAAEEAVEAMARITALVRRLVDAGRLATTPRQAGAAGVAAGLRGAVAVEQARFGERVRWEIRGGEGLRVAVPSAVLHDILLALLANAGEAIPEERSGLVEVLAAPAPGGQVRIAVVDDGRGLEPEVAARAFEPFFTTKPAGRGGGLGVSVARGLAESHGGTVQLSAHPGGGAEAVLELTRAPEPTTPTPPATPAAPG